MWGEMWGEVKERCEKMWGRCEKVSWGVWEEVGSLLGSGGMRWGKRGKIWGVGRIDGNVGTCWNVREVWESVLECGGGVGKHGEMCLGCGKCVGVRSVGRGGGCGKMLGEV